MIFLLLWGKVQTSVCNSSGASMNNEEVVKLTGQRDTLFTLIAEVEEESPGDAVLPVLRERLATVSSALARAAGID
jgi:hypothetical protein